MSPQRCIGSISTLLILSSIHSGKNCMLYCHNQAAKGQIAPLSQYLTIKTIDLKKFDFGSILYKTNQVIFCTQYSFCCRFVTSNVIILSYIFYNSPSYKLYFGLSIILSHPKLEKVLLWTTILICICSQTSTLCSDASHCHSDVEILMFLLLDSLTHIIQCFLMFPRWGQKVV